MHAEYLDVVAAVLFDRDGRVLLTQRPRGKPLAGLWEFPGGKRNQGETPLAALARELREELGIEINDARPLLRTCHQDTAPALRLDTWRIDTWSGEPAGLEQQALAWVPVDDLEHWPMPGPDRPIISALRLPPIYAITPEPDHRDFLVRFEHLLKRLTATTLAPSQTRLVQLRCKRLDDAELRPLAMACRERAAHHGTELLLNGRPGLATELGLGLHLTSAQLRSGLDTLKEWASRPGRPWLAASCHDTLELDLAAQAGCDFVVVAPVLATVSHPGAATIGWSGLHESIAESALPCYALGGLGPEHLERARACGAIGIAGIRSLWNG